MTMQATRSLQLPAAQSRGTSVGGIVRQTRLRASEGHLSVTRQVMEMAILKLVYGLGPGFYHTARFWRSGLSWDFKTGFWPYRKFRRFVRAVNPEHYQKLSQNKVSEKAILQLANIPTACFLGCLHRHRGFSAAGERLTDAAQLYSLLLMRPAGDKLCFKLVEGYGGKGFRVVEVLRDDELTLRLPDSGEVLSVAEFLAGVLEADLGNSYIIEEYIEQHQALSRLNPSSVNTLRIWVACIEGETAVIDAFLRVGRRGALVDNTSMGAQIFRLDIASGTIGVGMAKSIENATFECHRDSGERISGARIPFWREALGMAQDALKAFPHISFAGVDVAITAYGPVVVELNVEPDPTSAIIFDRSHRELLSCFDSSRQFGPMHRQG